MRWDRKKLPEPNLHVYDKDDTKIMVYNMRKWPKKIRIGKPKAKKIKSMRYKNRPWKNLSNLIKSPEFFF